MSSLNHSGEESSECPLCMEPLEMDDLSFYPCTCGYQVIFCIFSSIVQWTIPVFITTVALFLEQTNGFLLNAV
jgi:hypothetical protein